MPQISGGKAKPTEMPFGVWIQVGPRKHMLDGGAYWRHLANTTEPSMCCGNVAFCQITMTTCFLLLIRQILSTVKITSGQS